MDILPPPAERLARSAPPTAEQIAACGERTHPHFPSRDFAREFIRTQLGDGTYPQLVLRLGTVIQIAVSVRRPPASVLFASDGEDLGISHG